MNRSQQIEELLGNFETIKRRMVSRFHPIGHCRHKMNVTPAQTQLLFVVKHHPDCGITEIAELLGVTKSAATQLVDNLVGEGLLVRKVDPSDHRAQKITISARSLRRIRLMRTRVIDRMSFIFEKLDNDDLETFVELSRKIIEKDTSS